MNKALCQLALDRVMAYLQEYGVEPGNDVCRRALKVVDAALEPGSDGAMERVIDLLPLYFDLSEPRVPVQRPAMHRGSIGYWPHV